MTVTLALGQLCYSIAKFSALDIGWSDIRQSLAHGRQALEGKKEGKPTKITKLLPAP
jgi:hypothetical protein